MQISLDKMAATIGYLTLENNELKRENTALREIIAELNEKLAPKEADAK